MPEEKPKRKPSATTLKVRAYAKFARAKARVEELRARKQRVCAEIDAKMDKAQGEMKDANELLREDAPE